MKTGIVGCGNISAFHIKALKAIENVEIVALCDVNRSNLNKMKDAFKIEKTYNSMEEMLKSEDLDVVHIVTPPDTHKALSIQAMSAGCHVFVEKPIALSVSEVDEMLKVATSKNVRISVNHNLAFDPIIMRSYDMVNSYSFGKLVHVDIFFGFDKKRVVNKTGLKEDGTINHWSSNLKGGLIADLSPHPFSILLKFIDDYDDVFVIHKKLEPDINIPENELRLLVNSGDTTANIAISLNAHPDSIIVNLIGTKMTLKVDVSNRIIIKQKLPVFLPKPIGRAVSNLYQSSKLGMATSANMIKFILGKISDADGINYVINEFYNCLNSSDLIPPVTGREARNVIKLMNDVWK